MVRIEVPPVPLAWLQCSGLTRGDAGSGISLIGRQGIHASHKEFTGGREPGEECVSFQELPLLQEDGGYSPVCAQRRIGQT
jgi:hypothetical protein